MPNFIDSIVSLLKVIKDIPVPILCILAGISLVVLCLIGNKIKIPPNLRRLGLNFGLVLFVLGIALYFLLRPPKTNVIFSGDVPVGSSAEFFPDGRANLKINNVDADEVQMEFDITGKDWKWEQKYKVQPRVGERRLFRYQGHLYAITFKQILPGNPKKVRLEVRQLE